MALERSRPNADALSVVGFAVLSLVMLATLSDYGLTYDEEPHFRYGEMVLRFYTGAHELSSGLAASSYGPGFDLVAALLRRISPWDAYATNHWLCVFVAQIGLLGTWRLGRLVAGPPGGLISLLFLALTPVYYGHQFNNPKDIPFAAGYVWGLYFIARLVLFVPASGAALDSSAPSTTWEYAEPLPRGRRHWWAFALALALGMLVRVGGAVLLAYLAAFLLALGLDLWRQRGVSALRGLWPLVVRALGAALGGALLMTAAWPRALDKPLDGAAAALQTVTQFTKYDSPTLLRGKSISSNHVPWDYLPTYFLMQLPELITLCVLGTLLGLIWVSIGRLRRRAPLPLVHWLLVVSVLLPPCYAIAHHSTLYNGLRHFLFLIPPLGVLGAAGLVALAEVGGRHWRLARPLVWLVVLAFTIDQVRAMWILHPDEHVFFNRASGGIRAAVGRYETEYYGSVYRELLGKLLENTWQERRDTYLNTTFTVTGCGSKLFFTENLPLNFEYRSRRHASHADFYATYVRDGCLEQYRDRVPLTRVERAGALLAVARDLHRKIARPARSGASP